MADASYEAEIRRLKFNWAKNMNPLVGTIQGWAKLAERWDLDLVILAVDRCIAEAEREPMGFADFASYLPPLPQKAGPQIAWWSHQGEWGGDWSKVSRAEVLEVAAIFWVAMRPSKATVRETVVEGRRETFRTSVVERQIMHESDIARCQQFLDMVYRLQRRRITEGDVLQAVNALNEAGTSGLRAFIQDPEGYERRRAERRSQEALGV